MENSHRKFDWHGGDDISIYDPGIGITGSTYYPLSNLSTVGLTDLMSAFFKEKGLD